MKIKHVFFDLDHTLWDFDRNSVLAFDKILKQANVRVDFDDFIREYKPINAKYWKKYREEKVTKEDLRYYRLKDTFDQLNYEIKDQLIDFLSVEYIRQLPNFNYLFEGTIELLDYLKEKYYLHIITNGFEEIQSLKMKKSGIYDYFNEIITSESVGVKKPNPKVFEFALSRAEAEPSSSVMIGDNLEADIEGALNCKMEAIHFNPDNNLHIPKNIPSVNHLLEIKRYI